MHNVRNYVRMVFYSKGVADISQISQIGQTNQIFVAVTVISTIFWSFDILFWLNVLKPSSNELLNSDRKKSFPPAWNLNNQIAYWYKNWTQTFAAFSQLAFSLFLPFLPLDFNHGFILEYTGYYPEHQTRALWTVEVYSECSSLQ